MSPNEATPRLSEAGYRRLLGQIRDCADRVVPADAAVAVVSRGDDRLLQLGAGRVGLHFPQTADGRYAGHHPAGSADALAQLDRLRDRGARYLLIPQTAFWWMEHYGGFADHLEQRCQRVSGSNGACRIYRLEAAPATPDGASRRLAAFLDALLPDDAVVYVSAGPARLLAGSDRDIRRLPTPEEAEPDAATDPAAQRPVYLFVDREENDETAVALAASGRELARRRHLGRLYALNRFPH